MFQRTYDPHAAPAKKSVLLLGPRQTGKSTLLQKQLPGATYIDLLDSRTFRQLSATPELLHDRVRASSSPWVVIDEIQRIPELTYEVQRLMAQKPGLRFVLTGSSARKLRKQGTNLLGGRLTRQLLCPLTLHELSSYTQREFAAADIIAWGGLPHVLLSEDPATELEDYVGVYLKEEIQSEAQVRNMGQFTRFLNIAALSVGQQIIFSNVANDCQVPASTVRDYFQLLEDTLVGHLLPAYQTTQKRKAHASSKFYFFDVEVANSLRGAAGVSRGDAAFGSAYEHLIFCELLAWRAYHCPGAQLFYWRSLSNFEVDFVLTLPGGRTIGIEVKATQRVTAHDTKGLRALQEDVPDLLKAVVCEEGSPRETTDGVHILTPATLVPWLNKRVKKTTRRAGR